MAKSPIKPAKPGKAPVGTPAGPDIVSNGIFTVALNVLKGFGKPNK